ncbi:MAG TPA: hydrogenase expression/formation C-terminal domain-containing protein [Burkholderiales bacterium]|nr:hydrogenase expression/formation C-terminal domain-containing protein [Burkholderiales bacterium]
MTRLQDIGVKVVDSDPPVALSGNAPALLHEIAALLARLVQDGSTGTIDLRGIPLTPADRTYLREQLGEGEVRAQVNALGPSEVRETAYRGVWWLTHHDAEGELCAELIEVTPLPAILASDAEELAESLQRLHANLSSESNV